MKIFGFCIHRWQELVDWVIDASGQGGKYVRNTYRRCRDCGKYQVYNADWGVAWWEDCNPPDGVFPVAVSTKTGD